MTCKRCEELESLLKRAQDALLHASEGICSMYPHLEEVTPEMAERFIGMAMNANATGLGILAALTAEAEPAKPDHRAEEE